MNTSPSVQLLDLKRIDPDPRNPRQHAGENVTDLAESLTTHKLFAPIHVRPAGERYIVIFGERRYHAARRAGWRQIPAVVRDDIDAAGAIEPMIEENARQRPLNAMELARAMQLLTTEAGLSQAEAAKRFGHNQSWCCNLLRLLRLPPEWQQRVADGSLATKSAIALLRFVHRGDVLAAVEKGLEENPGEWESTAQFERRLLHAAGEAQTRDYHKTPRKRGRPAKCSTPADRHAPARVAVATVHDEPERAPRRSPAPTETLGATVVGTQRLVRWLCDLLSQLVDLDSLELIQVHLDRRREELASAR